MWRKILAIVLALAGVGWFLQGTGVFVAIPSFMNYDTRWAVIGIVTVVIALLIWPRQNKS